MTMNAPTLPRLSTRALVPAAVFALTACAHPKAVDVPAALQPTAAESLSMIVAARGVQIYECRAPASDAAAAWTFVAPDAELYDQHGRSIGHHGAGPFWQLADGSRVVGSVKARAEAPVTGAIPWLLLATQANGPQGRLSPVTSVLRVNTAGGTAPTLGCSRDKDGARARVIYTADYHFFSPR